MSWIPKLEPDASVPLHVQIRRSIRAAVSAGTFLPGQQLPDVRTLAGRLGVNRLTVLKAVRALARAGLLTTVQGKGVYIAEHPRGVRDEDDEPGAFAGPFFEGVAEGPIEDRPADRGRLAMRATVDDMLSGDTLAFSAGFPPPEAIPVAEIRRRLNRLLRTPRAAGFLGYTSTAGDPEFVEVLRSLLEARGIAPAPDDEILVTAGAQNGLCLCLDALVRPGEALALESPGYMGTIGACRLKNIPMIPVPVDRRGLNPERLETALRKNEVSAIYTVANFQNPTGVTQGLGRRRQILELAARHRVLVIEDDIYAGLRFGGRGIAPMRSLPGGDRVVYLGSFSKSLAPGLRLGFLLAPGPVAEALRSHKEITDISTGALVQALAADLLRTGFYRRHLVRVRRLYRERRDAMLVALEAHMPDGVSATRPKGGLHLWVMLDEPTDMDRLRELAASRQVSYAPGELFFSDGRRPSAFRLNYASHTPERIEEGVRRLAGCIRELREEGSP